MANGAMVQQYIVDGAGKQIGVILPIEDYQALLRLQSQPARRPKVKMAPPTLEPLYGALSHLGGVVAPTEQLDETRHELWAAWDRNDTP